MVERKKTMGKCVRYILAVLIVVFASSIAVAQDRQIVLRSAENVENSGLWRYVLPRFKLKAGIKVILDDAGLADVAIVHRQPPESGRQRQNLMVHGKTNQAYTVEQLRENADAGRFIAWLLSDIGQRTISGYQEDGAQVFYPLAADADNQESQVMTGDTVTGEEVSIRKCGRCHVVSARNKYGGIDSTPSFAALRTLKDWREKYAVFWTLNPHPSFTQIEEITEPFDPAYPPHIYPIFLTLKEVENIGAFMETIAPADLGAPIKTN